jgi:hypothetical protein
MRHLVLTLALAPLASAQEEKITFDDHVMPIFQQACLNCHNPDKARGGLDLSTYAGTLKGGSGGKIVEPGDTGSTLITVTAQTAEPIMPPEGDKIAADHLAVLKKWIEGGLLENKSSAARKPSKPKFETALRSDPAARPDGPPPMPEHLLLEPPLVTPRASAIHSIATSPWAPLLAVTGQRQILLHHSESLELVGILSFPEGDPISLHFTPDARYLIVGGGIPGKSGVTVTFDITTGQRQLTVGREFDAVLASDIRPGFDVVATGGPSRLLKLWNTETGEQIQSIKKHTDWITALDISPDGVLLASGDRNGGVYVWESETANEFHTLRAHQAGITSAVFRADSNVLATASEDGTVRFWEMTGGNELRKNDAHPGGVTALAFSRDGRTLTAGRDRSAKLWKPDFSHERDLAKDLPALPTAVALDFEGTRAFIADALGTIHVFDTAEGKPLGQIKTNPPTIQARLESLAARASEFETTLANAGKSTEESTAARQAAAEAFEQAEKARRQADQILAAARTEAEKAGQALEAHRQLLAGMRGEIERLSHERESAHKELLTARQTFEQAPEENRDPAPVQAAEAKHAQSLKQIQAHDEQLNKLIADEKALAEKHQVATQTAKTAEGRIQPLEEELVAKRSAKENAEKAATEAAEAIETAKNSLASLHAATRHWQAAAINTRALHTSREAEEARFEAEDQLAAYSESTAALSRHAATLNAKRQELRRLAAHFSSQPLSPEVAAELDATLAALTLSTQRLRDTLRALEAQSLTLRDEVDRLTPRAHQVAQEAQRLREEYLHATAQASTP